MNQIAYIFPGQGSQFIGMGKQLCEKSTIADAVFNTATEILGIDIKDLCFNSTEDILKQTKNTQCALLTTEVAYFRHIESFYPNLPMPHYYAGHSLGEYSALVCAGYLSFENALRIVYKRGELMQEALKQTEGSMCAINGLSQNTVENICKDITNVAVSVYNSSKQTVISGKVDAIHMAAQKCETLGGTTHVLNVEAPFHCDLMKPIGQEFQQFIQQFNISSSNKKVISNFLARPYQSVDEVKTGLVIQLYTAVKWDQSIDYLIHQGVGYYLEIGPGKVLKNLLRSYKNIHAFSIDTSEDFESYNKKLLANVANISTAVTKCLGIAVSTKNCCFEEESFHTVQSIYNELINFQSRLELDSRFAEKEELEEILEDTRSILIAKGLGKKDIKARLDNTIEIFMHK